MAVEILMPALSPTMEEGTLSKWLVKEGDAVKSGQILAEIETDKATMEFEAVDEGVVGKLLVAEGTGGVKVNTPIAVLLEDGEVRTACVKLAADAASAIGIAFASIDVVRVDGEWKVLEINSGVMMEALGKLHPELVQATYDAALDRVFGEDQRMFQL